MAQIEYDLGSLETKEWKRIWVSPNGYNNVAYSVNGNITIDESFLNYQEIMIITGRVSYHSPVHSQIFLTKFLQDFYLSGISREYGLMLSGYYNEYCYLNILNDTTFNLGSVGMGLYAIYVR